MGARSSWPVFALSHHLLVRVAATRAGFKPTWCDYALLGDDIVLTDPKVAGEYRKLISSLGVEISKTKTHVSNDTYEFAKRWVRNGVEITGPRINGFFEKKYYLLAENLFELLSRWFNPQDIMAVPGLAKLLSILKLPIRKDKIELLLLMPKGVDREENGDQRIRLFLTSIFGTYLGCSRSTTFLKGFAYQTLAEMKTHFIEIRLKSNFQKAQPFLKRIVKLASDLGMDGHAILHKTPAVESVISNIKGLQADYDRLRSAYWDSEEDIVFNRIIHNGIDPERV